MTDIEFRSDITAITTRVEGEDLDIARAAWVSTKGERAEDEADPNRAAGLINMLMRDRHGSPFEQVGFQFLVSAPIFVWREHMRHRIASYNEESGRYTTLKPVFYVPSKERPLVQKGKPGAYTFIAGNEKQTQIVQSVVDDLSRKAYEHYEYLLDLGIAKEVARTVLPINIYSTAYTRMNLRSLMNFISLRTKDERAKVPSFPLYEIDLLARAYESAFSQYFPIAFEAFIKNGRVSP